ncbi:hypothetical protein OI70_05550 [Dickeya fangzhongdai]|nr:hypothetical protein OI70_05550 [Dickeya fangzhongdai]
MEIFLPAKKPLSLILSMLRKMWHGLLLKVLAENLELPALFLKVHSMLFFWIASINSGYLKKGIHKNV